MSNGNYVVIFQKVLLKLIAPRNKLIVDLFDDQRADSIKLW